MFVYMSFVILVISEMRGVHCPETGPSTPNLSRSSSGSSSYQSSLHTSTCDRNKVNNGTPDAHEACHTKCLHVKEVIKAYYRAYPDRRIVICLFNKCGRVNQGRCVYRDGAYIPYCLCYTPDGMRDRIKTPLWRCRFGISILHTIIKDVEEEMGEKDQDGSTDKLTLSKILTDADGRNKIVDNGEGKKESREEEEDDDEKSGEMLVISLLVSDEVDTYVNAVVDTGSSVTMIHRRLAGENVWPLAEDEEVRLANNEKLQIFGRTLLFMKTERGERFSLSGLVTNHHFDILLGNDFNTRHTAKINIPERSMSISVYKQEIKMDLQFIKLLDLLSTVNMACCLFDVRRPLKVIGSVNGYPSKIWIDTAASISFVNKNYVKDQNIRQIKHKVLITQDAIPGAIGKTDVSLAMGGTKFSTPALVVKMKLVSRLILGNTFIKHHVEVIDFGQKTVSLVPFGEKVSTVVNMIEF